MVVAWRTWIAVAIFTFLVCDAEFAAVRTGVALASGSADGPSSSDLVSPTSSLHEDQEQQQHAENLKLLKVLVDHLTALPTLETLSNSTGPPDPLSGVNDTAIAEGLGKIASRLQAAGPVIANMTGAGGDFNTSTSSNLLQAGVETAASVETVNVSSSQKNGTTHPMPLDVQLVHLSWVFMFASVTIFMGFLLVHIQLGTVKTSYKKQVSGFDPTWLFLVSGLAWVHGFVLLCDFLLKVPGPLSLSSFIPAFMKLVASAFFVLQPMTKLVAKHPSPVGGIPFANLYGIILFHFGNMFSSGFMLHNEFDSSRPFAKINFPTWGMLCYTIATVMLTTANYIAYYQNDAAAAEELKRDEVQHHLPMLQLAGSFMLVLGSLFYLL